MHRIKVLLSLVVVLSIASASIAFNIVHVDVNGPNDPGSGTYEDPFRRIQDAIDITTDGDVIEIQPGLYTGSRNYNLDPKGKSITIRSTDPNDPNIVTNTIIDPNGAGRGFHFHSGEDANCIISGLTIRNAYTLEVGAGIYCEQSSPTIKKCFLTYNHADVYGGAVFCMEGNSLFENCNISNNSAYDGGGVSIRSGYPLLINCIISNNYAIRYGGGVDCYYQCNPNIVNCSLISNTTESGDAGGAISMWDSNVSIKNSILWANETTYGTQLYLHFDSSVSVSYCDIQGGVSDVCAPSSIVNWGNGNIDIDPCFALFDYNNDPNRWDFHLQSAYGKWEPKEQSWVTDANTSPCIDAGDSNSDWSSELWPNGKRINMGAYGGTSQASKNGNPADFNIDNSVNFVDFSQMANRWLVKQMCIEDLTNDGKVNFADISIFAENWLWEKK